jgi:hypothetical protein
METLTIVYTIYDFLKQNNIEAAKKLIEDELYMNVDPEIFPNNVLIELLVEEKKAIETRSAGRATSVIMLTEMIRDRRRDVERSVISKEQKTHFEEETDKILLRIAKDILGIDLSKMKVPHD